MNRNYLVWVAGLVAGLALGCGDGGGTTAGTGGSAGAGGSAGTGGTGGTGDACDDLGCDPAADCDESGDAPACVCPDGYTDDNGDGTQCTDIDECTDGTDDCDALATCTNTPGSFTCECPPGYTDDNGDGTQCTDIDECTDGSDDCHPVATCTNEPGSFSCDCPANTLDTAGGGLECEVLLAMYPYGGTYALFGPEGFIANDYNEPDCDGTASYAMIDLTDAAGVATITGGNGAAKHPNTGETFVAVKVEGQSGRSLGTLDTATGEVTIIGNMGDNVAGIAFDNEANLVAVTGDGATASETLFLVDQTTAAMTQIVALGAGSDGEVIAFNTDDDHLYHWSGRDTSPALDRIALDIDLSDPLNPVLGATVTPVTRNGYNYDEAFGAIYGWPTPSEFGLTNLDQELVQIALDTSTPGSPASDATLVGSVVPTCSPGPSVEVVSYLRGLVLVSAPVLPPAPLAP